MSTVAAIIVAYYLVNLAIAWYFAGVRKVVIYDVPLVLIQSVISVLLIWGVVSLDS